MNENIETGKKKFQNRRGVKAQMFRQRDNKDDFKTEFHYTPEKLVNYCLSKMEFDKDDFVLDVGAGKNMVWYNNINVDNKDWCEIELGRDFFDYNKQVDWCIGNPPFKFMWKIIERSCIISNKGFGFLFGINCWNMLTPKRINYLNENGFYLQKIYVVNCKKWFGRYFFVIFDKKKNDILNYSLDNFGNQKEIGDDSQQPRMKQTRGGELKSDEGLHSTDNVSSADIVSKGFLGGYAEFWDNPEDDRWDKLEVKEE